MADGTWTSERSEPDYRNLAGLLQAVDERPAVSQRELASELGIALGLVNAYLKVCIRKGLIKVKQVPSRRYAYFLTPKGFAEKSRVTAEYLSRSLAFFRNARESCDLSFDEAERRGWRSIAFAGASDLMEIALICATQRGLPVAFLLDGQKAGDKFLGVTIVRQAAEARPAPDGWIVTDIASPQSTYDTLGEAVGFSRVLAPALLSVREMQP